MFKKYFINLKYNVVYIMRFRLVALRSWAALSKVTGLREVSLTYKICRTLSYYVCSQLYTKIQHFHCVLYCRYKFKCQQLSQKFILCTKSDLQTEFKCITQHVRSCCLQWQTFSKDNSLPGFLITRMFTQLHAFSHAEDSYVFMMCCAHYNYCSDHAQFIVNTKLFSA